MARRTTAGGLLAAVLALAVPITPGHAAGCDGSVARADKWTELRPGGGDITSYAAVPTDPASMYVTDGHTVYATHDGGCSWTSVVSDTGGLKRTPRAVAVSYPREETVVWVLSDVAVGPQSRPEVLVATAPGDAFVPLAQTLVPAPTTGLPPGTAVALGAGTETDSAYVLVDTAVGRKLYATDDRGQTWLPRGVTNDLSGVTSLAVDPVNANDVWAWGGAALLRSRDGGATFAPVDDVPGPVRDVAVVQSPKGGRIEVVTNNGDLWRSDDSGLHWHRRQHEPRAVAVAAPPVLDLAVAAGRGLVRVFPSTFAPTDLAPTGDHTLTDVAVARFGSANRVRVTAVEGGTLLRRDLDIDRGSVIDTKSPDPTAEGDNVTLLPPPDAIVLRPRLLPERNVITLKPGETRTLPYTVELPPEPTPLDVYFLVDTTGSMQPVIDALRRALARIVNDLTLSGIRAEFGVGSFRDYPVAPYGDSSDKVYETYRGIGPVDSDLADALARLKAGGGGDDPEAQFTGLYESVRQRAGLPSLLDWEPDPTNFRNDALRLVVVATDTSSHRPGDNGGKYPGPSYARTLDALLRAKVRTLGIAAAANAHADLRASAEDTGDLAPEGGIDCNADGKVDIQQGDPLVCDFDGGVTSNAGGPVGGPIGGVVDGDGVRGMSSAIVSMLRAQRDPTTVRVASSDPAIAAPTRGAFANVDVKSPSSLADPVRFTCPAAYYGRTVDVTFPVHVRNREVASSVATVRCLAPIVAPAVVPPAQQRPLPLLVLAPVAPAPPAPVNNVNPNTNPNLQVHTNVNAQTGAVTQEEQQAQLALVTDVTQPEAGQQELAMSAIGLGAALAAACGAVELRRRSRTRAATVRAS